jgi:hypothetical protein
MLHAEVAFRRGARGFLVERIQAAFGTPIDGIYGQLTEQAAAASRARYGLSPGGHVCSALAARLGVPWPDAFLRCLNLTSVLEGTSFGGFNVTDEDGAGLTYGCVGFTTAHGEVQEVLRRFFRAASRCAHPEFKVAVQDLLEQAAPATEWRQLFFGTGKRVLPHAAEALRAWGAMPAMMDVQVAYARERFWLPSERNCGRMGFQTLAARAFFFDVHVQNGAWRQEHARAFACVDDPAAPEPERLAAAARIVAASSRSRWRSDVAARKMLFAKGRGVVHGLDLSLRAFALG